MEFFVVYIARGGASEARWRCINAADEAVEVEWRRRKSASRILMPTSREGRRAKSLVRCRGTE